MYFESPLEKFIREQRERESRKTLASLLAAKSPSLNATSSVLNPFLKALSIKRKVFVSFHHKNDQSWFNYFTKTFAEQYDIIHDKSLGNGFVRSNELEYVNRAVRESYIKGSSVTIVLCGSETPKRKFVDWEVYSTLHCQHALLGIALPTAKRFGASVIVPDRLHHNVKSGYAHFFEWMTNPTDLKHQLEVALEKSKKTALIDNSMEKMKYNRQ